jgi:Na+/H+-dicarboxylate symporter
MGDIKKLGRVGLKTITYYLSTTALAVTIGLILGNIITPGIGLRIDIPTTSVEPRVAPGLVDTILDIFPTNPLASMVNMNMLQIIVFALFLGVTIAIIGKKGEPLYKFFESLAEVMYKLTGIVMEFAPYGVFALIATVVGNHGLNVLLPLLKIIIAVYLGCIIHAGLTYSVAVSAFAKMNPIRFFKGIVEPATVAFSTASSAATLPVTMRCTEDNLGVSKGICSFVLPLGATINMDGTALYQGVCALFIAQVYGIPITLGTQLTIVATATLASIGTAGVPGAGMIMLTMVLTSVGLPLDGILLIAGIDRILDMARTSVNIIGDASAAVVVAATEGELIATPNQSISA